MHDSLDRLGALAAAPRRLLAVFAHPDDEAYGCAGALARAGFDEDTATVLVTLTDGEASTVMAQRGLTPEDVGRTRRQRMQAVAERLGLDALLLPGFPDGALAREPLATTGGYLTEVLRAFRPQVLISQDARGVNGHLDHVAAHWACRHAMTHQGVSRFAAIAYPPEVVELVKPRLLFPTANEQIDVILHLSDAERDAKEDCLCIHEAMVTIRDEDDAERIYRPPLERYDLLGEAFDPVLDDLFAGLG